MNLSRLEFHLENWRDYMQTSSSKLGYPSRSLCMSSGGASGADEFELMCESADLNSAMAIDAIIDGLIKPQRVAINHTWLRVSLRHPAHEYDLLDAYKNIMKIADRRGVI